MTRDQLVVVTLGTGDLQLWQAMDEVASVVTLRRVAASGRRLGSLALGLGVDATRVALRAVRGTRSGTFVATNPWIGIGLRTLSRRPVVVLGVYAAPGGRTWRLFRRILGDGPVVTTAQVEADNWNTDGGTAAHVLYGNTFPYSRVGRPATDELRIFVGGSSDRESALVDQLTDEVLAAQKPVSLVVATGGPASRKRAGHGEVVHHARLSQEDFGRVLASADIAFLPLRNEERAAGHMLTVGALQTGVPVAATPSTGMDGYVDGRFVRTVDTTEPLLPQLDRIAREAPDGEEIVDYWRDNFSREAFLRRVVRAVRELGVIGSPVAP